MKTPTQIVAFLPRLVVGVVFLLSGFVKGVDPWGTAIKLEEYAQAFGIGALGNWSYLFAVLLCAGEMWLGLALLFRLGGRSLVRLMVGVMLAFTLLTGVLAIWAPIEDCGCFGDALHLSNGETLLKNIILLLLVVTMLFKGRTPKKSYSLASPRRADRGVQLLLGLLFAIGACGISIYGLRHLPLIDFLPFTRGAHIPSLLAPAPQAEVDTKLIYKDITSGETHEFALSDTTWYDTTRWEFVDSKVIELTPLRSRSTTSAQEFALFDSEGDHAPQWLEASEPWLLITLTDTEALSTERRTQYEQLIAYAHAQQIPIRAVTPTAIDPDYPYWEVGRQQVALYNIDGTTLKTLIRAKSGLVLFAGGVLLEKWNSRDIPQWSTDEPILQAWLSERERARTATLLSSLGGVLLLGWIIYVAHPARK